MKRLLMQIIMASLADFSPFITSFFEPRRPSVRPKKTAAAVQTARPIRLPLPPLFLRLPPFRLLFLSIVFLVVANWYSLLFSPCPVTPAAVVTDLTAP
ncbi:hypothetical protein [Paraburkholderia kururiensis]|uniref:Uncharacterized protein n=1 Tax=Paraburkholderia kururiensis TaxID=984307 RepID=A0ABZ0WJX4_9BURK|nr:hypothetical protein [Paraburkholderia kururiensis]WQD77666.1 hypothetical protein U0042_27085 [Paraburkholderia kururiensis]